MPNQPKGAIVGLGVTPMGKIYGRRAVDFAAEAIALALDDAGLNKSDVDGLLINANLPGDMDVRSQMVLGFENLTLVNVMSAYGSTAGSMMQYACLAIRESLANVVVLVYADAPLSPSRGAGQSYAGPHRFPLGGMTGLRAAYGNFGANPEISGGFGKCQGRKAGQAPSRDDRKIFRHHRGRAAAVGSNESVGAD